MNILLTGATGYIGRRLKQRLLGDDNVRLRLFVRNAKKVREQVRDKVDIVEGDTFHDESLQKAVQDIDVVYYLIHAARASGDFQKLDRISAEHFRDACIKSGVKRIIYLSQLSAKETTSPLLLSRQETGEILSLKPDKIQTLWFRTGHIIGSGSASFEILMNLVQKLPIMITPKWVSILTYPIAVDDVVQYLVEAKDLSIPKNLIVDLKTQRMSFLEMIHRTAQIMELRRVIIPIPFLIKEFSTYWLVLFTSVPYLMASALIEGLTSASVAENDHAKGYFPNITPMPFEDAVREALKETEKNQIISRWCDSSAGEVCDIKEHDDIEKAIYTDRKVSSFENIPVEHLFASILSVGGESGWFRYNFLWEIRGLIDKFLGGYGTSRGRRDGAQLRMGDCVGFWKVADLKKNKRLLLLAQMKVPGKAWLEFTLEKGCLVQTAYFYPIGLWGRFYWYLMLPFHFFIFRDLAENIIEKGASMNQ